jgi:hypothetical protein
MRERESYDMLTLTGDYSVNNHYLFTNVDENVIISLIDLHTDIIPIVLFHRVALCLIHYSNISFSS